MFDRVLGLPAHPLFIHAAVVLVPLLALTGILYAVWPAARRHIRWPLIVLALATPGAVYFARESGLAFSKSPNFQSGELKQKIVQHEGFANNLFYIILGLGLVALIMWLVIAATPDGAALIRVPVPVHWVVSAVTVILAAAALYYVFRTGDSGAHMVWSGF